MQMIEFDDVVIDVENHKVTKGGETIDLEPKSFRVLLFLVENRHRVVPKDELITSVWNGTAVTDNALTRVIAQLRKGLGDDAKQARFIETVPTVGYRFIAELKQADTPQPAPAVTPPVVSPPPVGTPYEARKITWYVPAGAVLAVILAYFMPVLKEWTRPASASTTARTLQFTAAKGLDASPSFSPDGGSIAYTSDKSGHFEIYMKQVSSGGAEIQITRDGRENIQPAWAPDGSSIAYTSIQTGGISVVPALGGMPRKVSRFGSQPAWTADSKRIVFVSDSPTSMSPADVIPLSGSNLWIVEAAGGEPKPLTQPNEPPGRHGEPALSPDGQHLLLVTGQTLGNSSLVEMNLTTRQFTTIPEAEKFAISPSYSKDGNFIYYVSQSNSGGPGVFRLKLDPRSRRSIGPPEILYRADMSLIRNVSFSPDGRRFAYGLQWMSSNLWQVDEDAFQTPVTDEASFRITQPVFSPDGSKIAYVNRLIGASGDIWVVDADGRNPLQVTKDPMPDHMPSWSADGKTVMYASRRNGGSQLMQFTLADGSEKQLFELPDRHGMPRVSPDGTEIVYNVNRPVLNVWKANIATGKSTQLTFGKELSGFACWSPDGKWLAFEERENGDTHLAVIPSTGGQPKRLTNRRGQAWTSSWSPDGKEIPVAALWENAWNIYAVNRETQAVRPLTKNTLFRIFLRYPSWSPKGTPIVFERNETRGNVFLGELPN